MDNQTHMYNKEAIDMTKVLEILTSKQAILMPEKHKVVMEGDRITDQVRLSALPANQAAKKDTSYRFILTFFNRQRC